MKVLTILGGLAATTLVFAYSTTGTQDSPKVLKAGPVGSSEKAVQTASNGDMKAISDSYRHLRLQTLETLNSQAISWSSTKKDSTHPERDAESATPHSNLRLDEQRLLIAACSGGMVAGAPHRSTAPANSQSKSDSDMESDSAEEFGATTTGWAKDDDRDQDSNLARDASEGVMGHGQVVGMILVCSDKPGSLVAMDSKKAPKQAEESSSNQEGTPVEATVVKPALLPGVYAVNQLHDSVWLTDNQGQIVLETMLYERNKRMTRAEMPGKERTGNNDVLQPDPNWNRVFHAITMETMSQMAWTEDTRTAQAK